jgi:hypothetical protein
MGDYGGPKALRLLSNIFDAMNPDRPRDILYPSLSSVFERKVGLAFELVADAPSDADSARFGEAFQARRDVDAVAVDVRVFNNHIAGIHPDAELDPAIGWDAGIVLGQFALDIETATHRVDGAVEFQEKTVASGSDQSPVVLRDFRLKQIFHIAGEAAMGPLFIDPHEARIPDHIRHQNGGESASQVCVSHANHLIYRYNKFYYKSLNLSRITPSDLGRLEHHIVSYH